jgi:hypothetical protein
LVIKLAATPMTTPAAEAALAVSSHRSEVATQVALVIKLAATPMSKQVSSHRIEVATEPK